MRIREIEIKNYRSLKDVKLKNLKSLNVFIGKNGSGKSNVLEALELFFKDLNLLQQSERGFEENLWFDRDNKVPISFKVKIELSDKQIEDLFTTTFFDSIHLSANSKIKTQCITIEREIQANRWNNKKIAFGDWNLSLDNVINVTSPAVGFIDTNTPSIESKTNVEALKDAINEFAPINEIAPSIIQDILTKLNAILVGKFRIVPTTRESSERLTPDARSFLVDLETRNYLTSIGQNVAREESVKWSSYKKVFKDFSTNSLEMRGGAVQVEMDDLYLPLNLLGGGDQEILILERLLLDSGIFFGVEEPETHLHAAYQRKLFNTLKSKSKKSQFFITTHSSVFVDKIDFENSTIWLVKQEGKSTIVEPIIDKEDGKIKEILVELGIKMSDVLFPEKILFVEGSTEKEIIPLIANHFKFDFSKKDVEIIGMRGKDTGKYHIKMWYHISKNSNLPIFFIFDNDAKKEIEECISEGILNEGNHVLLNENDIEDYYPEDKLKQAIQSLYPSIKSSNVDMSKPRKEKLKNIFKKHDILSWKVDLGKNVISRMESHEIKSTFGELKKVFEFLSE